ncbi:MAG TPA: chorismate synthase [Anaerolineae bacterium]|nr:chorismate synthase [Anaerolineae bacterium]HQH39219.1 chorismate synthase [Anaerolineae bacterium]
MEILGGPLFAVAGAGESHGPGYTTIVFGCPPGLWLTRADIQRHLDRRRPGANVHGTPRREADRVVLLSGLYTDVLDTLLAGPEVRTIAGGVESVTPTYSAGYTTGEPIAALVLSAAKRTEDYAQFAGPTGEVRPGHADLVKYHQARGFSDPRGGGRASYRATISDVIGGSIARLYLERHFGTVFLSSLAQVGALKASVTLAETVERLVLRHTQAHPVPADDLRRLEATLAAAELPTLDADFAREAAALIESMRAAGDSIGAVVEVIAVNVPPLAGAPLYNSLKLRLMGALGGLHAVQGVEIGSGFDVVSRRGSENNDPIRAGGYQSNHHGGLLGGITTGMPLVCRVAFKPTASIQTPQLSVRQNLDEIEFTLKKGRHDPCVGVRAGVTLESRMAIELLNAVLVGQSCQPSVVSFQLFNRADEV